MASTLSSSFLVEAMLDLLELQNSRPLSESTGMILARCTSKVGSTSLFIRCTAVTSSLLGYRRPQGDYIDDAQGSAAPATSSQ